MALRTSHHHHGTIFHNVFLVVIAFCVISCSHYDFRIGTTNGSSVTTIFAKAASSAEAPSSRTNNNLNKLFKGMGPGMQQKMSLLALTTSKIDSEEEKAAIRKQFQRTFHQNRSTAAAGVQQQQQAPPPPLSD